jgi:hypothetical protein
VVFCIEVYKGVFLMMAAHNLWILDQSFQCFFSFATPAQIKKLNRTSKQALKNTALLFSVLNQPFRVDLSSLNDGNNVLLKNNTLHILGFIEGHPYYLRYAIVHRIGALKLEGYHPL